MATGCSCSLRRLQQLRYSEFLFLYLVKCRVKNIFGREFFIRIGAQFNEIAQQEKEPEDYKFHFSKIKFL
jgi:hypothetical protein